MNLEIDGKAQSFARAVQFDRVSDQPIPLISAGHDGSKIKVHVPVVFENEAASPGMKRGAVPNVVRKSVEVSCLAKDIPSVFALDLTGTDVNDSLKWSSVEVLKAFSPPSVTATS